MDTKKSTLLTMAALLIIISVSLTSCTGKSVYTYDTLIKGGLVYDGSTANPAIADVGVRGDKVAAVGRKLNGSAVKTIDATGMIVTPGFVDVHNHTDLDMLLHWIPKNNYYDFSITDALWKQNHNYLTQGVTTIVTGLCGGGVPETADWLNGLNKLPFGSNVYHLIPYGMLRTMLFGDNQPTTLTSKQLETLKTSVEKEMQSGALGFSVGLEYAPDCFTTTDELVEIARVVAKYGGLYDAHIRDQTGIAGANGRPGVLNSIRETIEIAKRAHIPVHISHIQLNLPWNNVQAKQMSDLIEQARSEGVDITADQHPYDWGYSVLSYRLPAKFKTGLGVNEKYKTSAGKAEMRAAIKEVFTFLGPEKIMLTSGPVEYRNKTIAEIAGLRKQTAAEAYVDLSCLDPAPFALFHEISDKINRQMMPHEYVFTASDGYTVFAADDSPHPRFFGCFPRKIRKYALEEKLLTLQDAIRSMTSLPAAKFKIKGRGMIAVGNYADIAVIDLTNFKDNATYPERGLYSEGVGYLLVNGVLSINQGKLTGDRGGRAGVRDRTDMKLKGGKNE
ncbi:MAG: amidohydrolase family protein [Proteobacteria bacterium]|nr:amidohydrolase family protein [Pseudomonadota bacterium]MBU1745462.1 amidohydrolase family protein [Pseudomonadota bacterium]